MSRAFYPKNGKKKDLSHCYLLSRCYFEIHINRKKSNFHIDFTTFFKIPVLKILSNSEFCFNEQIISQTICSHIQILICNIYFVRHVFFLKIFSGFTFFFAFLIFCLYTELDIKYLCSPT